MAQIEEKIIFDVSVNAGGTISASQNIKKQLREANQEAIEMSQKFGATSKEAIAAAQKVANLKEEISDVKDTINALHPEAKFNAISSAVSGIAGGFAAVEGAMALFGTQSEEVQKQLLKVQGALALSQGLNEVMGLGDAFKNLGIVVKASTAIQTAYNFVVGTGTAAMKAFRIALAATGIGALVLGLIALITNFDKVSKWVTTIVNKFEWLKNTVAAVKAAFNLLIDPIRKALEAVNILDTAEENAAEANLERIQAKIYAMEDFMKVRQREIELAKAQGVAEEQLRDMEIAMYKERLDSYLKFMLAKIAAGETLTKEEKDQIEEVKHAYQLALANRDKDEREANEKLEKERADRYKKEKEELERQRKERQQKEKEEMERQIALQKQLQDQRIQNILDNREREIEQTKLEFQRKLDEIKGQSQVEIDLRRELILARDRQISEINERYYEKEAADEMERVQQEFLSATNYYNQKLQQAKQNKEEQIRIEQQIAQAKNTIAQNSLNSISSIGNLFIKDQNKLAAFNKKVAIVQLGIDTAKSISSTIAGATAAAAAGGPAAPYLLAGYITSGIATVLGSFVQAKKILGDTGNNPSVGNTGANSGSPRFTATVTPQSTLSKQSEQQSSTPIIKAIVTETDISRTTNRVNSIKEQATF